MSHLNDLVNAWIAEQRRKPAIAGYNSFDIEFARKGIEEVLPLFLSAVKSYLDSNEHVADMVDFKGFADRVTDLVADELTGPMMKYADELEGN